MKRILSGVEVPLRGAVGVRDVAEDDFLVAAAIVVLRCRFVVSAEGGGGSDERSGREGRRKALHKKHSPVP